MHPHQTFHDAPPNGAFRYPQKGWSPACSGTIARVSVVGVRVLGVAIRPIVFTGLSCKAVGLPLSHRAICAAPASGKARQGVILIGGANGGAGEDGA